MKHIIGIDQGATKTAALVMDETGRILVSGVTSGANHASDGLYCAMEAIRRACLKVTGELRMELTEADILVAGVAGADWPYEYVVLREAMKEWLGIRNLHVYNDCIVAMRGGTLSDCGAVLCAGTGVNCAVKSPDGEFTFGYYIDDNDQGGIAFSKRALRQVFNARTGMTDPTALTALALKIFNEADVDSLLHSYVTRRLETDKIKEFAKTVLTLPPSGDEVIKKLVCDFGRDLSRYIHAGLKKYGLLDSDIDVVLSGSLFKGEWNQLYGRMADEIAGFAPRAKVVNAEYEPVVGAAVIGLKRLCGEITDGMKRNIDRTARQNKGLIRGESVPA